MASYICNLVHFVWSTSRRQPLIEDAWQDRLYGYIGGVLRKKKGKLLCAGSMPDHVHLLASLPSTVTLADMANAMKTNSSRWVHEEIAGAKQFKWQEGYGAFTVSKSGEAGVVRYIEDQQEHHRRRTFKEEFIALLKKHGIEYDERYIWA